MMVYCLLEINLVGYGNKPTKRTQLNGKVTKYN